MDIVFGLGLYMWTWVIYKKLLVSNEGWTDYLREDVVCSCTIYIDILEMKSYFKKSLVRISYVEVDCAKSICVLW